MATKRSIFQTFQSHSSTKHVSEPGTCLYTRMDHSRKATSIEMTALLTRTIPAMEKVHEESLLHRIGHCMPHHLESRKVSILAAARYPTDWY